MATPEELRARLLATFRGEAAEHVRLLAGHLAALDRGLARAEVAAQTLAETFRVMHTLKGAARSVGRRDVEGVCHACESVLASLVRSSHAPPPPLVAALAAAVDDVALMLDSPEGSVPAGRSLRRLASAEAPAPAWPPAPPPAAPGARDTPAEREHASADTLRVATSRLDALLLRAEEMLAPRLAAAERVAGAAALVETLAALCDARQPAPGSSLREARAEARILHARLLRDERALGASVAALAAEARLLRTSRAAEVLDLFPAMARDLARQQGKEVDWDAEGADLEVDRKVLEGVKDPLIHLARNAVDHGIEAPLERSAAGKPARGRIRVRLSPLEGGRIEVRVEDDGRGIDPARVRAAAARCRIVSAEAAARISDAEAVQLVCAAGLSTSPLITELSGHGLGLAIVKDQIERLGGTVQVASTLGSGTTVTLVLPATVTTFRGLLVRAGDLSFLLPPDAVERAVRIRRAEVRSVEGRPTVSHAGGRLPVVSLAALCGGAVPELQEAADFVCVIVHAGGERAALAVTEVLGEREVLVKELRPPVDGLRQISGAAILGSGGLALILRPAEVLRASREASAPPPPRRAPKTQALRVLVADDSITTRTMERNLLEAAGYVVQVAADGADAWRLLKSEPFDALVSDVDMPRLDGFELTRRIRADPALAELPVVLVTALESRDDKERGIEVGANAYVAKSSFDQSNLLSIIRRLA